MTYSSLILEQCRDPGSEAELEAGETVEGRGGSIPPGGVQSNGRINGLRVQLSRGPTILQHRDWKWRALLHTCNAYAFSDHMKCPS